MTARMKPIAATISACVVTLAFTGPVLGGGYEGSGLPRSGGPIDDDYFATSSSLERSDFAAFDTESVQSGRSESTPSWGAAAGLPRSGGHVEDWYLSKPGASERSEFAAFETKGTGSSTTESMGSWGAPGLPSAGGHVK